MIRSMMIEKFKLSALVGLSVLLWTATVSAQLPQTRLYAIAPNGGQIGQEFEVTLLAGDDLEEVSELHFTHPGIKARQKTVEQNGQQQPVNNTFIVNIPADVPAGVYEVRCGGLFGFSNPRRFAVDHDAAILETANNNSPATATPLELGQVVNGRFEAASDVDWFRFSARQGERVIVDIWSERLDSRANPVLSVFDSTGRRRLAWSRRAAGNDPLVVFDVPADGDYCVLLHDVTYRGGNEYQYRLHCHAAPHLEFAWPPVGTAGTRQQFELFGYNLPGGQKRGQRLNGVELESVTVEIAVPGQIDHLDVDQRVRPHEAAINAFSYRFTQNGRTSNPVRISISQNPVVAEQEPNDTREQAQTVVAPIAIGGQFSEPGDQDRYRFEAKAGEVFLIEVTAERLGTSADPFLIVNQIIKKEGAADEIKRLTAQDGVATNLLANVFETRTDDPVFRLEVPADGLYEVQLQDRYWESRGDPGLQYVVEIRRETPDFRVVALPDPPTVGTTWPTGLRQGDNFAINVLAFRQDGFNGPIKVNVHNLPEGLQASPVVIRPGETSTTLVISSTVDTAVGLYELELVGTATIENPVAARAVPGAQQALDNARKPLADLQTKLDTARTQVTEPQQALNAAVAASEADPENADLKAAAAAAQAKLDPLLAEVTKAEQALAAAQAVVAQAEGTLQAAQAKLAEQTQSVDRRVRAGTVVWNTANNVPAISRVTAAFTVSVMGEPAPFQLKHPEQRFTVHQGRQILLPMQLEKRQDFDDKVTLTAQGIPKDSNLDFPNIAFEKGEAAKTQRLLVKENTPPGLYTLWLKSQGQVAYRRNPAKAERLKEAHETAKASAEQAKQAEQAATQAKTAAAQAFTTAQQGLQQAQANLKTGETALTTAQTALEQSQKEFAAAEKRVADLKAELAAIDKEVTAQQPLVEKKTQEVTAAEKAVADAEAARQEQEKQLKSAEQVVTERSQASANDPENAELKQQLEVAQEQQQKLQGQLTEQTQKVETARKTLQTVTADRDAAQQKLAELQQQQTAKAGEVKTASATATELQAKVKGAEENIAAKQKELDAYKTTLTAAETGLKTAEKNKADSEAAETQAQAANKAAEAARQAAEKAATDAANAANPKNANFTPPSLPVVVEVLPAPVKVTATVPNNGQIKQGGNLELTVKVERQHGFAGPVSLALQTSESIPGLEAAVVEIPADQTQAKLIVQAAGETPEGGLVFPAVRATVDFNGPALIEAPVTLSVVK